MHPKPKVYAPRGATKEKTVQVRLLPEERRQFERLVKQLGVSESSLGRDYIIRSMQEEASKQAAA